MRYTYIFLFTLTFSVSYSQTLTKKYNNLNNRYEYFGSDGNMVGYQFYDKLDSSWKYYELPKQPRNSYISPINTNLINQALASKQSRLNFNLSKIEETIQDIGNRILELNIEDDKIETILDRFNLLLDKLSASKPNYGSTSVTQNIINWLYNETNNIIKQESN